MSRQLPIRFDERLHYASVWEELREGLLEAIHHVSLKEAAYQLDCKPSLLSHCMNGRDHHHLRAEWIPYLVHRAPNDRVIETLADIRGLSVAKRPQLTAEERLERLERVLGEALGPSLRASIYERAYR